MVYVEAMLQENTVQMWLLAVVGTPWESAAEQALEQLCEPYLRAEYDRAIRRHEEKFGKRSEV